MNPNTRQTICKFTYTSSSSSMVIFIVIFFSAIDRLFRAGQSIGAIMNGMTGVLK